MVPDIWNHFGTSSPLGTGYVVPFPRPNRLATWNHAFMQENLTTSRAQFVVKDLSQFRKGSFQLLWESHGCLQGYDMSYGLPGVHVSGFKIPWSYVPEDRDVICPPVSQRKKRSRPEAWMSPRTCPPRASLLRSDSVAVSQDPRLCETQGTEGWNRSSTHSSEQSHSDNERYPYSVCGPWSSCMLGPIPARCGCSHLSSRQSSPSGMRSLTH